MVSTVGGSTNKNYSGMASDKNNISIPDNTSSIEEKEEEAADKNFVEEREESEENFVEESQESEDGESEEMYSSGSTIQNSWQKVIEKRTRTVWGPWRFRSSDRFSEFYWSEGRHAQWNTNLWS